MVVLVNKKEHRRVTHQTKDNTSFGDLKELTEKIKNLPCRFPRVILDPFGRETGRVPCRSSFIYTCLACSLRQRADRYTLALDGIEGLDPRTFAFLTLTAPPGASANHDAIREWNGAVLDNFNNLIAGIRRKVAGVQYIRAIEFQKCGDVSCTSQRAGLAHVHALLRFDRLVTEEMVQKIWHLLVRTSTKGASGRRLRFGRGPKDENLLENFISKSIQRFQTERQVRSALSYTLKSTIYRAVDQMGFSRFVELDIPEDRTRANRSGGAGFRGRLSSWSQGWSALTLKSIRRARRSKLSLPNLKQFAAEYVKSNPVFDHGIVAELAYSYACVLLVHVREVQMSRAVQRE